MSRPLPHEVPDLTPRELEILRLRARGLSVPRIAAALFVSEHDVRFHLKNLHRKFNVHNRFDLAEEARRLGFLPEV